MIADVPRKEGRPLLDPGGSTTPVSVRLANTTYDALYACARARGLNVSMLIRVAIEQQLVEERRRTRR